VVRFLGMLVWLTYPILWCQKGGTTKHEDVNGEVESNVRNEGCV